MSVSRTPVKIYPEIRNLVSLVDADSPFTIGGNDDVVVVSAVSGDVTVNLPPATGTGREIKVANCNASGAHNAVVTRNGTDTISGAGSNATTKNVAKDKSAIFIDYKAGEWAMLISA